MKRKREESCPAQMRISALASRGEGAVADGTVFLDCGSGCGEVTRTYEDLAAFARRLKRHTAPVGKASGADPRPQLVNFPKKAFKKLCGTGTERLDRSVLDQDGNQNEHAYLRKSLRHADAFLSALTACAASSVPVAQEVRAFMSPDRKPHTSSSAFRAKQHNQFFASETNARGLVAAAVAHLGPDTAARSAFVEAAAGTGHIFRHLPEGRRFGVEIDARAVAEARRANGFDFLQGDFLRASREDILGVAGCDRFGPSETCVCTGPPYTSTEATGSGDIDKEAGGGGDGDRGCDGGDGGGGGGGGTRAAAATTTNQTLLPTKNIMVHFIIHSLAHIGNTAAMILPPLCARDAFLGEVRRAWEQREEEKSIQRSEGGRRQLQLHLKALPAADDKFLFVDKWITKPAIYLLAWLGDEEKNDQKSNGEDGEQKDM